MKLPLIILTGYALTIAVLFVNCQRQHKSRVPGKPVVEVWTSRGAVTVAKVKL